MIIALPVADCLDQQMVDFGTTSLKRSRSKSGSPPPQAVKSPIDRPSEVSTVKPSLCDAEGATQDPAGVPSLVGAQDLRRKERREWRRVEGRQGLLREEERGGELPKWVEGGSPSVVVQVASVEASSGRGVGGGPLAGSQVSVEVGGSDGGNGLLAGAYVAEKEHREVDGAGTGGGGGEGQQQRSGEGCSLGVGVTAHPCTRIKTLARMSASGLQPSSAPQVSKAENAVVPAKWVVRELSLSAVPRKDPTDAQQAKVDPLTLVPSDHASTVVSLQSALVCADCPTLKEEFPGKDAGASKN